MLDVCNACRNAMQEGNCVTVVISSREFARPRDHDYNLKIEARSCRDGNHFKVAINGILKLQSEGVDGTSEKRKSVRCYVWTVRGDLFRAT